MWQKLQHPGVAAGEAKNAKRPKLNGVANSGKVQTGHN